MTGKFQLQIQKNEDQNRFSIDLSSKLEWFKVGYFGYGSGAKRKTSDWGIIQGKNQSHSSWEYQKHVTEGATYGSSPWNNQIL